MSFERVATAELWGHRCRPVTRIPCWREARVPASTEKALHIGEGITRAVLCVKNNPVCLGLEPPTEVKVSRHELLTRPAPEPEAAQAGAAPGSYGVRYLLQRQPSGDTNGNTKF